MTQTWTLLSPLGTDELLAIAEEAQAALSSFGEDGDGCGDIIADADVPSSKSIAASYAKFGTPLDESVMKRLDECKSCVVIEDPADLDRDPIQVAVIRYFVDRMGKGFVLFDDFPVVETELVLIELKKKKTVKGFAPPAAKKAAKKSSSKAKSAAAGERRAEKPGEVRAVKILRTLEAVGDNPDLAIDVRDLFRTLPVLAQRYAAFLIEEGAVDDETAAAGLKVPLGDLTKAIETLDSSLKSITG